MRKPMFVMLAFLTVNLLVLTPNQLKSVSAAYPTKVKALPQENIFYTNTTSVGHTFTLSVIAENVIDQEGGMAGWEIILSWTAGLLNCTGQELNYGYWPSNSGPLVSAPIDNTEGTYHQALSARTPSPSVTGTYWLLNVTFKIISAPPKGGTLSSDLKIDPAPGLVYCIIDKLSNEIPHDFIHGTYKFISSEPPPSEPQHDIAVIDVKTNKTVVGENYPISINVTVENQGDYPETFNVTVYVNDTVLGTYENVSLEIGESTVLTPPCEWNTTGLPKGNYTVKAYAFPVLGEKQTEDNTRENWVFITILGDVNGDKVVNIKDAVPIGVAFGANPSDPRWDPNADLNDDYFINVKDIVALGASFGQSWP